MKINKIYINNFGIYNGEYEYDFSVTPEKNVVLVSGRNGSGKTTLLNTVKLAIYGPKLYGSLNTQNKQYTTYIESNLNAFAKYNQADNFSVAIDFSMLYKNKMSDFYIKRSWSYVGNSLKEDTFIYVNDQEINSMEISTVFDYIHRHVPKTLFDLFFFDGEKINDMFMLKNDLSEMLNHVYNLNLFLNLGKDLKQFKSQVSVAKELSSHEVELENTRNSIESTEAHIISLTEKLQVVKSNLEDLKDEKRDIESDFHSSGGLNTAEQDIINKQIQSLQAKKSVLENEYKFLVEYLPFIMLKPQLEEITEEVQKEDESSQFKIMSELIHSPALYDYLKSSFNNSTLDPILNKIKDFSMQNIDYNMIYNLTAYEKSVLFETYNKIKSLSHADLENCLQGIDEINKALRELNGRLEEASSEDLREHLQAISQLSDQIGRLSHEEEQLTLSLSSTKETLSELKSDQIKLEKELKELHKESNLGNVIDKVTTIINTYSDQIKIQKQAAFEKEISSMFNKLIRKDEFISQIRIDDETGEIKLYNTLGGHLPKENLSAGEKQIYILSILFGILSLSKNKVPLVFDTLLGRLDHAHKTHIVESFIKNCGEQVIILATDTEIDEQYFELLKPMVNNYYKIDYDSTRKAVSHQKIEIQ